MGGNSSKEAEKPVRTQSFAVPNKISKKYKKAIVVIGKMASGKSSFVKMLTHPEDKSKIKIKTSNKSVTVECSLYRVDPTLKLFSQDLFVVDTPGLDTKEAVFLTIDKLNEFILNNQLQIMALFYVLDIHSGREEGANGKGHICTFFDHMKLRNSIKKQRMTCVLSYFDKYYKKPQGNQKLYKQYQQSFAKQNIGQIWDRKIEWMSEPKQDVKLYSQIITDPNHEANKIYRNQWVKLKKSLVQNMPLNFETYMHDYLVYKNKIKGQMRGILKQNKGTNSQFFVRKIDIKMKDTSHLSWFASIINKIFNDPQLEGQADQINVVRQEHQKMLWKQIQQFLKAELQRCTSIKDSKIYIQNSDWIEDVEGQVIKTNQQSYKLNFNTKDEGKEANIREGKLTLKYKVKTPSVSAYEQFSKGVAIKHYGGL